MRACESEDLPAVPGAPRPVVHRLAEWAVAEDGSLVAGGLCSVRRLLAVAIPVAR